MTDVKKKIYVTECNGQKVDENGEFVNVHYELNGRFTVITATKKLRRMNDDPSITINHVKETQETYRMELSKFIENAEKVISTEKMEK